MAWQISAGQGRPEDEPKSLEWHLKAYEHDKLIAKSIAMLYEPSDKSSWLSAHLDPKVRGIVPDKATSEEWNRRWQGHLRERRMLAVAAGSYFDARELGEQFFAGKEGATQDYAEAMKWYLKAAELGDNWSCGQIAKMHLRGFGVPADVEKGLAWLDRQYAITYCEGTKVVDQGLIYHWVMRPVVEGYLDHLDEEALFAWLQARTRMYVPGCAALSGSYYGEGETAHLATHVCKVFNPHAFVKDPLKPSEKKVVEARAARITRLMDRQKAAMIALAESGDAAAQFWHAKTFKKYKGRAGRALKLLLSSAEQGFSPAQYEAGECHVRGDGAPVSEPEARKWFEQASLRGHVWAQRELLKVLSGTSFWGDRDDVVERKPDAQALFEGYAWHIVCDYEADLAEAWRKYNPERVHAAYLRASEIRAEMARHDPKQGSAAG
jgi:TPR repeat protein